MVEQTIRSMWRQESSPEFGKSLVELSREILAKLHENGKKRLNGCGKGRRRSDASRAPCVWVKIWERPL